MLRLTGPFDDALRGRVIEALDAMGTDWRAEIVDPDVRCEQCDTRGAITSEDGQRLCAACETQRVRRV